VNNTLRHVFLLLKRIGIILMIYTLCRLLFYAFNFNYFADTNLLRAFWGGIRFDLSALAFVNSPLIILSLLPFKIVQKEGYQKFLLTLFVLLNALPLFFNLTDIEYFKFTSKRSTADFFDMVFMSNDVWKAMPSYIVDYWYIAFIFLLMLVYFTRRVRKFDGLRLRELSFNGLWQFAGLFVMVALFTVFSRGGLQLRPINNLNAIEYGRAQDIPLILNTPFSMMKTFGKQQMSRREYMSDAELESTHSALRHFSKDGDAALSGHNVVIVIMESFSMDFVKKENSAGLPYTPFLNSLSDSSFIKVDMGMANGRKSMEAMPAIIAGIPSLMNDPFITSRFNNVSIDALPLVLGEKGYSSAFFHGGSTGTMGFDVFAKSAGFQQSFWREDYPDQDDYDGTWGIYDGPFMRFSAEKISEMEEPYLASVFSLSSHHPYSLPEDKKSQYAEFEEGLPRTIRYADDALRDFFKVLGQNDELDSTLFVITADHTPSSFSKATKTALGVYSVPIIFYAPSHSLSQINTKVAQHIDIMPTVLDLIDVDVDALVLGRVLGDGSPWSIQYLNEIYQISDGEVHMTFDGEQIVSVLDVQGKKVSISQERKSQLETKTKAIIQQYNNRLLDNKMTAKNN
jgi:phosphoglycerol transferase MdoB-like AlkP superfamily enzyme